MKISDILVLIALSLIFEGACAWWAAAGRMAEPIILSFGAAFAAIGLSNKPSYDVLHFEVKDGWYNDRSRIEKEMEEYEKNVKLNTPE